MTLSLDDYDLSEEELLKRARQAAWRATFFDNYGFSPEDACKKEAERLRKAQRATLKPLNRTIRREDDSN